MRLNLNLLALLLSACLVAACSIAAPDGQTVTISSENPRFIGELLAGEDFPAQQISGTLITPQSPPPWPAVVMLHSASGQGAIDWSYAELLMNAGYAVLAVDSFSQRGVYRTVDDQTRVSGAAMVLDAYAARDVLVADSRVDPERIAVLGFSKGGIAALYSAFERVRVAAGAAPFAAHVAHYPWCGLQLLEPRTTGAPILLQIGDSDSVTPLAFCETLVGEISAVDPNADVAVLSYPDARHAFDHPALSALGWVPISGMIPGDCLIQEQADGEFVEVTTGMIATGENLADVLTACGRNAAEAGGDAEAAQIARQRLLEFLDETIGN